MPRSRTPPESYVRLQHERLRAYFQRRFGTIKDGFALQDVSVVRPSLGSEPFKLGEVYLLVQDPRGAIGIHSTTFTFDPDTGEVLIGGPTEGEWRSPARYGAPLEWLDRVTPEPATDWTIKLNVAAQFDLLHDEERTHLQSGRWNPDFQRERDALTAQLIACDPGWSVREYRRAVKAHWAEQRTTARQLAATCSSTPDHAPAADRTAS